MGIKPKSFGKQRELFRSKFDNPIMRSTNGRKIGVRGWGGPGHFTSGPQAFRRGQKGLEGRGGLKIFRFQGSTF